MAARRGSTLHGPRLSAVCLQAIPVQVATHRREVNNDTQRRNSAADARTGRHGLHETPPANLRRLRQGLCICQAAGAVLLVRLQTGRSAPAAPRSRLAQSSSPLPALRQCLCRSPQRRRVLQRRLSPGCASEAHDAYEGPSMNRHTLFVTGPSRPLGLREATRSSRGPRLCFFLSAQKRPDLSAGMLARRALP